MGSPNQRNTNGIFLLFEGLPPTIIESQVLSHASCMRRLGLKFDVWAFATNKRAYSEATAVLESYKNYGIDIKVFRGFRPAIPLSEMLNAILMFVYLRRYNQKPDFIHCRTEYAAAVAGFLKLIKKFRLIWDSRGDTLSEFFLARRKWGSVKRCFSFWKLLSIKFRLYWASRQADKTIFVSKALSELHGKGLATDDFEIIPCVAEPDFFYYCPTLRSKTREKLNILETEKVLIYVGSLAPWQCFDQVVELITSLIRTDSSYRAIIITTSVQEVGKHFEGLPANKVLIESARLAAVNAFLNAADYAIFLRRQDPINFVASPVKFAEYCLSGLPIVMTDAVNQAHQVAATLGNSIPFEFGAIPRMPEIMCNESRIALSEAASQLLTRDVYEKKFLGLYRDT